MSLGIRAPSCRKSNASSSSPPVKEPFAHQEVEAADDRAGSVEERMEAVVGRDHVLVAHDVDETACDGIVPSLSVNAGTRRVLDTNRGHQARRC
jgi:hypothetical protein